MNQTCGPSVDESRRAISPRVRFLACVLVAVSFVALSCDSVDLSKMMPDRDKSRYFENEKAAGHEEPSFGEQLFYVLYHDIEDDLPDPASGDGAFDTDAVLAYRSARQREFLKLKDEFVAAADSVASENLLEPLQDPGDMGCRVGESALECSLRSMLDKIDDGTLPRLSRTAARILRDLLDRERLGESDLIHTTDRNENSIPDWIEDVLYLKHTNLLFTQEELVELLHQYFDYYRVYESLHEFARMARGLDLNGEPNGTEHVLPDLMNAIGMELGEIDVQGAVMSLDTEIVEKALKSMAEPDTGPPAWVVEADDFGNPKVAVIGGVLPKPFVDKDGDGQADVDSEGRPIDEQGRPIDIPPLALPGDDGVPRDDYGRALLRPGGPPIYEYVDFKKTAFGAAVRTLREMVTAEVAQEADFDKLIDWLATILGYPPAPKVLDAGVVFSASRLPFLESGIDLAYRLVAAARFQGMDELLSKLAALSSDACKVNGMTCHDAVAGAVASMVRASDVLEASNGSLVEHNTFADELLPYVREMAEHDTDHGKSLLSNLLESLIGAGKAGLGPAFSEMMRYRDKDLNKPVDPMSYREDFGPDDYGDRSTFQRLLHLISDTYKASYQPDLSFFPGLPEFSINDLAVFYLDALACNATVPLIFKTVVNAFSDDTLNECAYKNPENPPSDPDFPMYVSARQINRFLNDDNFFGNPVGREGRELRLYNGDTLFAFEKSGADMAFKPIAEVFSNAGATDLLASMLAMIHVHYSMYNQGLDVPGREKTDRVVAHLRSIEPDLAEILGDADGDVGLLDELWPALQALSRGDAGDGGETTSALDAFVNLLNFLTDPSLFSAVRDGEPGDLPRDAGPPPALDGTTRLAPGEATHLHSIVQGLRRFEEDYDRTDRAVKDAFEKVFDLVVDRFLLEGWMDMDNPTKIGKLADKALVSCVPLVAEEVETRYEKGTYLAGVSDLLEDMEGLDQDVVDFIEGDTLAAGMRFLVQARRDPQLRNIFRGLFKYLSEPRAKGDEPFFARDPYTNLSRLVTAVLELKASGRSRQAISSTLKLMSDLLLQYGDELVTMLVDLDQSIEDNSVLVHDRGERGRKTLFVAIRNLFAPTRDDLEYYPFETLGKTVKVLSRSDPDKGLEELDAADLYRMLLRTLDFLQDEHHGVERLYRIVCERKRGYTEEQDPCSAWLGE